MPDKDTSTSSSIITTNSSRRTSEQEFKYATTTEASTSPGDDTSTEKLDGKLTVGDITGIGMLEAEIMALIDQCNNLKECTSIENIIHNCWFIERKGIEGSNQIH